MIETRLWITIGILALLAGYQQFRIIRIRRTSTKREELFRIVTENAADMIALVDMKGHRLYNSPAYKRILGYSAAELGETSAFEQIHPDDRFQVLEAAREARETGVGKKLEYRIQHKSGTWRVFESSASTIRNEKGDVAQLVIVNRDITERRRAEEQLEHNILHDVLTGLPNRRLFLERLEQMFVRGQRTPGSLYAILLIDIDGFKAINHTLGTAVADQVLAEVARRLGSCLRHADTVARPEDEIHMMDAVLSRFAGDEFTVLLDDIIDPSNAMRVAKRIQGAVTEPLSIEGHEIRTSVSVGIVMTTTAHRRPEDLLQDVDVALRRAKALGGSRCELFDEAMHTQAINRLGLESDLRTAITRHQFRVLYHPVVALNGGRITGFEALLRWQHPVQGLISPDGFLEAAEDTGMLVQIGQWLIVEACRRLHDWQSKNLCVESLSISINVSRRQLAHPRLVSSVHSAVREAGLDSPQLHLEVTEAVAMADPKLTSAVISQLKHLGIGMTLDKFGSGSASLRCLQQFSIGVLKIDRSLTSELMTDRHSADIVEVLIPLAHKMGVKVIAEGIESAKQLEILRELGCDFGQGFLFSQPVEAEAAEQLLRQGSAGMHTRVAGA